MSRIGSRIIELEDTGEIEYDEELGIYVEQTKGV